MGHAIYVVDVGPPVVHAGGFVCVAGEQSLFIGVTASWSEQTNPTTAGVGGKRAADKRFTSTVSIAIAVYHQHGVSCEI